MAFSQRASQSMSQSQSRSGTDILDPTEKEKKINELMQYLLVCDQKKIPMKKKDINRVVLRGQNRVFNAVMEEASRRLQEVYGFKVVELQDKLKDSFILINEAEFTENQRNFIHMSEKESAEMGLLTVVLGMAFMNGNVIHEDEMWHALKKLGILDCENHHTFGNVRNLIVKEFVRQGYLSTELDVGSDPPKLNIMWGQRAEHEITRRNMLSLVCEFNETSPNDWVHQMQQIIRQEQGIQEDEAGSAAA